MSRTPLNRGPTSEKENPMWIRNRLDVLKLQPPRTSDRGVRHTPSRAPPSPPPGLVETLEGRRMLSAVWVSVNDAAIVEGNDGTRAAEVVVSLSGRSGKTITVNYGTAGGSATAGADYGAASGKLSFAPGQTSKSIQVPVQGDRLVEPQEYFLVNLSGGRDVNVARGQATVTIVDDEPRIYVSAAPSALEGNVGTTLVNFTVSLSAAYDEPVTVHYATADGSATTADHDYLATSGTLTFAPGETTGTITVEVIGDATAEQTEGFYVILSGASANALVTADSGSAFIGDDDGYVEPDPGGYPDSDPWSYWDGYGNYYY
jgi:hypothetical protein